MAGDGGSEFDLSTQEGMEAFVAKTMAENEKTSQPQNPLPRSTSEMKRPFKPLEPTLEHVQTRQPTSLDEQARENNGTFQPIDATKLPQLEPTLAGRKR